ncbi:hypothetical protein [Nonomuraea salmonea]|uniref:hypothetical protein n=1 Tax=Nonomuraea salmonea TaxID=46181 RepID=UPI0031F10D55
MRSDCRAGLPVSASAMSPDVKRTSRGGPTWSSKFGAPVTVLSAELMSSSSRPTMVGRGMPRVAPMVPETVAATMPRRFSGSPLSFSMMPTMKMASSGLGSARSSPARPQNDWNGTWCVSWPSTSPNGPYR